MTRALKTGRRAAVSGRTESVVVFLHGYGADGADLLGLADPLAPHLPNTTFLAPDAPERSVANPFGYQWFPIPWIDGSSEAEAAAGLARASADLQAWLDQTFAAEAVPADRVALVGFSQGTMMALEVAPRRREELAGVVGFSGRLLRPEVLEAEAVTRPPVLLLHGDADEVVAPSSMPEAADALSAAGFTVMAQYMSGMGHGLAPEGLRLALYFLREQLGYED